MIHTGLGGNTSIIDFVHYSEILPWYRRRVNIREILTSSCRDSFVIGSSYATKPHMPHYGHVRIINIFIFLCPCGSYYYDNKKL